jgi:hypothetical protein
MALYNFTSVEGLAQFLRARAVQLDEQAERLSKSGEPARRVRDAEIERNAWLSAAEIVRDSSIDTANLPTYTELREALAQALRQLPVREVATLLPVLQRAGGEL